MIVPSSSGLRPVHLRLVASRSDVVLELAGFEVERLGEDESHLDEVNRLHKRLPTEPEVHADLPRVFLATLEAMFVAVFEIGVQA